MIDIAPWYTSEPVALPAQFAHLRGTPDDPNLWHSAVWTPAMQAELAALLESGDWKGYMAWIHGYCRKTTPAEPICEVDARIALFLARRVFVKQAERARGRLHALLGEEPPAASAGVFALWRELVPAAYPQYGLPSLDGEPFLRARWAFFLATMLHWLEALWPKVSAEQVWPQADAAALTAPGALAAFRALRKSTGQVYSQLNAYAAYCILWRRDGGAALFLAASYAANQGIQIAAHPRLEARLLAEPRPADYSARCVAFDRALAATPGGHQLLTFEAFCKLREAATSGLARPRTLVALDEGAPCSSWDPGAALLQAEVRQQTERALGELPERQRQAIRLAADGVSRAEGAVAMGVSVRTYDAFLWEGRQRLRARLRVTE